MKMSVYNDFNNLPLLPIDAETQRKNALRAKLAMLAGLSLPLLPDTSHFRRHPASDHSTHKYTRQQAKARKHKAQMVKESRRRNWA